jgi:hypothetical protein
MEQNGKCETCVSLQPNRVCGERRSINHRFAVQFLPVQRCDYYHKRAEPQQAPERKPAEVTR